MTNLRETTGEKKSPLIGPGSEHMFAVLSGPTSRLWCFNIMPFNIKFVVSASVIQGDVFISQLHNVYG